MDPDVALQEIIRLAHDYDHSEFDDMEQATAAYSLLSSRILELDEWITHGGFLPARWSR